MNHPIGIGVGPIRFFFWSGAWHWLHGEPCDECLNLYWGPFGIELGRHKCDD